MTSGTRTDLSASQISLLLALDGARDALRDDSDPASMFQAIIRLLKSQFHAEASAIMLLDESARVIELVIADGLTETRAVELCWAALPLNEPQPLGVADAEWAHSLGLRVILDSHPLGSMVLLRHDLPFSPEEHHLLVTAESQIDSAIIQARVIWRLAQRNRELEAIYRIDRLRDSNPTESDLITDFTSLLIEAYGAEVCMVLLSHIDSGEMLIRGVTGKNLPVNVMETIRELVSNIHLPQVIATPEGIGQLVLLAGPLIVAGVRLGAIVVGRARIFTLADQRLLFAMASQMDSAIVYSRVVQQLEQRHRELETIYNIDRIRDQETDFDRMLQLVLNAICKAVRSEMGYLMLYDERMEEKLELKAVTVGEILTSPIHFEIINRISRQALEKAEIVWSNSPDGPVRSIIAIPLILNERTIGVFGTVNSSNPRGFNAEDRRMLAAITSQVDTAVFERLEQRRMRRVLARSIDPKALDHLMRKADGNILAGERTVLTCLFADLRGSTEWAERTEPETLVSALNAFLGAMTDVIFAFGGTLDKFMGDQVIALFGTPAPMPDHALVAVRTALAMQEAHQQVCAMLAEKGIELPAMGIGVSTGEVIAGEMGSATRTDFTALGKAVNLCARLCDNAPGGGTIISQATYELVRPYITVKDEIAMSLKGIGAVTVYEVAGLR
jgi:adenylate cyclase